MIEQHTKYFICAFFNAKYSIGIGFCIGDVLRFGYLFTISETKEKKIPLYSVVPEAMWILSLITLGC